MADSGRTAPRRRPRRNTALEMQQRALVQLMVGSVILFAITLAAAYFFVVPLGRSSVRSVAPLLGAFMEAGAAASVNDGHALFSARGLRETTRDDIAALFQQRHLFNGYERLTVTSFDRAASDDPLVSETAVATALVFYRDGTAARLDARLDLDDAAWRIRSVQIARDGP